MWVAQIPAAHSNLQNFTEVGGASAATHYLVDVPKQILTPLLIFPCASHVLVCPSLSPSPPNITDFTRRPNRLLVPKMERKTGVVLCTPFRVYVASGVGAMVHGHPGTQTFRAVGCPPMSTFVVYVAPCPSEDTFFSMLPPAKKTPAVPHAHFFFKF